MVELLRTLAVALLVWMTGSALAVANDAVFSVQNFPVEAEAKDAVTAKRLAVADGQRAAFRALLRRLVPVTAYKRLAQVNMKLAGDLISGFGVRTEQNSRTEYIARYDFKFRPRNVRAVLRRYAIPFVEQQAAPIAVVPIFGVPDLVPAEKSKFGVSKGIQNARLGKTWVRAWKGLDLGNGLAPIELKPQIEAITPQVIKGALAGDNSMTGMLMGTFDKPTILALADVSDDGKRWIFRLIGTDSVGAIDLTRAYTFAADDPGYSAENAAVVAMRVLEGRWKEVNKPRSVSVGGQSVATSGTLVRMRVEYASPRDWQRIRTYLATLPGVDNFETGALSTRGADVNLNFPGGGNALAAQLAQNNLQMYNDGEIWVLRTF